MNEADLVERCATSESRCAGLDVFHQEPPGMHPLMELDNVIVTPHAGGARRSKIRHDMALSGAQAIAALSRGEWPDEKVVNPEVRSHFRW